MSLAPRVVIGDLLDQPVEAIVNAWNRNVIPWWLLLPQGVSGAIKRRAGTGPFKELRRFGPMPLGSAVHTSAGPLPFKAIIHVAGIDLLWRASQGSIIGSVKNAVKLAQQLQFRSLAIPLIGAGSGSFDEAASERLICQTLASLEGTLEVLVVRWSPDPRKRDWGETPHLGLARVRAANRSLKGTPPCP